MRVMRVLLVLTVVGCGDNNEYGVSPALVAPEIATSVAEDGEIMIDAAAIDPEGEKLTYFATLPERGTLTGSGPTYTYRPSKDYAGPDGFTITISDGSNDVDIPVVLTVVEVNDAPVAQDLSAITNADDGVAVVLHATDVDSTALSYILVGAPLYGVVTGVPPVVTYTPPLHYVGPDAFSYQASDGSLSSNIAKVTIGVAHASTCGDGVVQAGFEQCDDGNDSNNDACLNTCAAARCGDGIVRTGVEQCDDGNDSSNDACLTTCKVASCGDGSVFAGFEQCDDGNTVDGDGCDSACHIEPPAAAGADRRVRGIQLDAHPMR